MSERAAVECLLRKAPFHFKHIFGFLTLTLQFGGGGGVIYVGLGGGSGKADERGMNARTMAFYFNTLT